jgi:hypothetical protein
MNIAHRTRSQATTRERALRHLRMLVEQQEAPPEAGQKAWETSARSELVKLLLAEKSNGAALEAFCGGPVATDLWAAMAANQGRTHPHDAIALYHRLLPIAADGGHDTHVTTKPFPSYVPSVDSARS